MILHSKKTVTTYEYKCGHEGWESKTVPSDVSDFEEKRVMNKVDMCEECSHADIVNSILKEISSGVGYDHKRHQKYFNVVITEGNRSIINGLVNRVVRRK